jgi:predicted nucleic acid-binding protein
MATDVRQWQYWDSVVFISLLQRTAGRYEVLDTIVAAAVRAEIGIVTSAFTMAEVVKLTGLPLLEPQIEKLIVDFFENDYIVIRNVDRFVSERSRPLIRDLNIKPPDAIHLATALLSKVAVLYTYDHDLLRWNGQVDGLRIEQPVQAI